MCRKDCRQPFPFRVMQKKGCCPKTATRNDCRPPPALIDHTSPKKKKAPRGIIPEGPTVHPYSLFHTVIPRCLIPYRPLTVSNARRSGIHSATNMVATPHCGACSLSVEKLTDEASATGCHRSASPSSPRKVSTWFSSCNARQNTQCRCSFYQTTSTAYLLNFSSEVMTGIFRSIACEIINRSKGSP